METIHVTFDELSEQTVSEKSSSGPAPNLLTPGPISSGLVQNSSPSNTYVPPTSEELKKLFDSMYDEYFEPPNDNDSDPSPPTPTEVAPILRIPEDQPESTSISQGAPNQSITPTSSCPHSSSTSPLMEGNNLDEVNPFAPSDDAPFENVFAPEYASDMSTTMESSPNHHVSSTQPHEHLTKWTSDHPIDNIIGNPSRPVSTRRQLATDALWCFFNSSRFGRQ